MEASAWHAVALDAKVHNYRLPCQVHTLVPKRLAGSGGLATLHWRLLAGTLEAQLGARLQQKLRV